MRFGTGSSSLSMSSSLRRCLQHAEGCDGAGRVEVRSDIAAAVAPCGRCDWGEDSDATRPFEQGVVRREREKEDSSCFAPGMACARLSRSRLQLP